MILPKWAQSININYNLLPEDISDINYIYLNNDLQEAYYNYYNIEQENIDENEILYHQIQEEIFSLISNLRDELGY